MKFNLILKNVNRILVAFAATLIPILQFFKLDYTMFGQISFESIVPFLTGITIGSITLYVLNTLNKIQNNQTVMMWIMNNRFIQIAEDIESIKNPPKEVADNSDFDYNKIGENVPERHYYRTPAQKISDEKTDLKLFLRANDYTERQIDRLLNKLYPSNKEE
ncbi:MAG: hypothetical protein KBF32_01640 [Chitinophagales bacterium]|nr:hypothetical protein [Chitinophagales bacterium]